MKKLMIIIALCCMQSTIFAKDQVYVYGNSLVILKDQSKCSYLSLSGGEVKPVTNNCKWSNKSLLLKIKNSDYKMKLAFKENKELLILNSNKGQMTYYKVRGKYWNRVVGNYTCKIMNMSFGNHGEFKGIRDGLWGLKDKNHIVVMLEDRKVQYTYQDNSIIFNGKKICHKNN